MADPYIPRKPGELLTSADWNSVQQHAREDIDALGDRVTQVADPKVSARESALGSAKQPSKGAQVSVAHIWPFAYGSSGQNPTSGYWNGQYSNYLYEAMNKDGLLYLSQTSGGYWAYLYPNCSTSVTIKRDSLVLVRVDLSMLVVGHSVSFKLFMQRSTDSKMAPLRSSGTGPAGTSAPTRATLSEWFDHPWIIWYGRGGSNYCHADFPVDKYDGSGTFLAQDFSYADQIELTPATYSFTVMFQSNCYAYNAESSAPRLKHMALRTLVIPLD